MAEKTIGKETGKEEKVTAGVYRLSYIEKDRLWVIKRDGAKRVIATFHTKEEALKRIKELSENQEVGFTVKKKNGRFQRKGNY